MLLECLLFACVVTLLIIVISIIIGTDFNLKETLAGIRKTIGAYKGPINSVIDVPKTDYRQVWTDGIRVYPCSECPDTILCPTCSLRNTSIESFSGGESPDPASGKNLGVYSKNSDNSKSSDSSDITKNTEHTAALLSLDAPVRMADSIQPEFRDDELSVLGKMSQTSLGPAYDLDPEFVSSRSAMGAGCGLSNGQKISIRGLTYDTSSLGTRNDDIFDGDRKVVPGCSDGVGKSSMKLLYTNVMGVENPLPFTASCEFLGAQGYLYKDTCALGTVYPL